MVNRHQELPWPTNGSGIFRALFRLSELLSPKLFLHGEPRDPPRQPLKRPGLWLWRCDPSIRVRRWTPPKYVWSISWSSWSTANNQCLAPLDLSVLRYSARHYLVVEIIATKLRNYGYYNGPALQSERVYISNLRTWFRTRVAAPPNNRNSR